MLLISQFLVMQVFQFHHLFHNLEISKAIPYEYLLSCVSYDSDLVFRVLIFVLIFQIRNV